MNLSQNQVDKILEHSKMNREHYIDNAKREELRANLIRFMYYVKGQLTIEQLDAINSWSYHSNLNANEILEKLEEN